MSSESAPENIPHKGWKRCLRPRGAAVAVLGLLLTGIGISHRRPEAPEPPAAVLEDRENHRQEEEQILIALPTPLPPWPAFTHPTPQRNWDETENPKVYMPTGSGRVASAGYGSVRTNSSGRASFHEGVDIAPVEWSRGRAVDAVFAASDGRVAYINRTAGNSSYGIYVVLEHQDDVGEVYTIYAHLASVPKELKAGQQVKAGQEIAVMGHSSTLGIPVQRSHLHFEMGMMLNPDFDKWYRKKKMTPNHGKYHGFNFTGFDPRLMLVPLAGKEQLPFSYLEILKTKPPAWELVVKSRGRPRYFSKYPELWQGEAYAGKAFHLRVSESGIPLSGRNATAEEIRRLGTASTRVLEVYPEVLGRNGLRHVVKSGGSWKLGSNGTRWFEILMYNAR